MRWTQAVLLTRVHAGVRRNRVVLTPRCWRQVREKQTLLRGDGGKQAGHRGERAISRKTIAQGRPDASAEPVCSCACSYAHIAHETAGAARTRSSLRPLIGEGGTFQENLAQIMRRDRENMHIRLYPRRPGLEPGPILRGLSVRALALNTFFNNQRRGVWVPAVAGTTL